MKLLCLSCVSATFELDNKDIHITFSNKVKEYILEKGYDRKYGARPLKRAIQKYIENELAESLLKNEIAPNDNVVLIIVDDKISIKV